LDITPEQWDKVVDSQAKAFLVGVQEAAHLMSNDGRVVADQTEFLYQGE
jgi:hypothetical protein